MNKQTIKNILGITTRKYIFRKLLIGVFMVTKIGKYVVPMKKICPCISSTTLFSLHQSCKKPWSSDLGKLITLT